ncbi:MULTISPECIES: hypothetical protein [Sorangium]|uniref:Uncharacterized protein n=1 Tax=Sorangium cellulosum TaxID=56 RepID=A0A4P2QFK6_SORCE|nr:MULTISPECIES: hypothetical protein [Sorangium]AUX28654.1 hypothetical protein SOCE836_007350 [Sorangium cellulosum]WCQ88051.1 hypothetical protein NQZ70_00722 [Sorangium sp. Soce836]
MTRIEAFIPTAMLFQTIADVARPHKAHLVLHRFETAHRDAALSVVEATPLAADEYLSGGYLLMYLALRQAPASEQDWSFVDREAANLLEFAGARQRGQDLELVTVRPVAKKTNVARLFAATKAAIAASCKRGVMLNGQLYPKIFYAKELEVRRFRLWVDIETKTISANVVG